MEKEEEKAKPDTDKPDFFTQYNVTFDGKNYTHVDPNGVKYFWDSEKNSWEKDDRTSKYCKH